MASLKICEFIGCSKRPDAAQGLCRKHYDKLRRSGVIETWSIPPSDRGKCQKWLREHVDYEDGDCLEWPFGKCTGGRGHVNFRGEPMAASRAMCILKNGPPPTRWHHAAHSCGNGHLACTNPNHLSWKTPSQNQIDRRIHGTSTFGTKKPGTVIFSLEQIQEIRDMRGLVFQYEIAAKFGVSQTRICKIQVHGAD